MRRRSPDEMLAELKTLGAHELDLVSLRPNRSTIWSLTRGGAALNLHVGFASAPRHVLRALATIASEGGRDCRAVRDAREVVRTWPGLACSLDAIRGEHGVSGGEKAPCDAEGPGTACCGSAEQRAYVRTVYRWLNETRFGGELPAAMPVRLSSRMESSLGHMLPGLHPDGRRYVVEIALNVDLLLPGNGPERIDTLLHEMAHAADYLHDGGRGHGSTWKAWAVRVGCRPDREYDRPVQRRRRRRAVVRRVPPLPPSLVSFCDDR